MNAMVRGLTNQSEEVFYTGKAGQAFISENVSEAFTYETLEAARRKASILNKGTLLHGIRFIGMLTEEGHAVAGDLYLEGN